MDEWKPRPHDHLVEPVFGGLGVRHAQDPHTEGGAGERAARRRLVLGALLALVGVGARALVLLARD